MPSDRAVAFVLKLGRALHAYGTPAHQLEDTLGRVAGRLALEGQFFSQPTGILAAFGPQAQQHTFMLRVEPGEVHLDKLSRLETVVGEVLDGALGPDEGAARVDAIVASPSPYPAWLGPIAFCLSSATASRFLGGGAREVVAGALVGGVIGALAGTAGRSERLRRVFEPLAALVAALIAGGLSFAMGPMSSTVALLAGLIVLLPGLPLATAMTELSTRHLASGTARLSGAIMVFLAMGFGVALGGGIIERLLGRPPISEPVPLPGWTEAAALGLAPLGFMVLLRAPLREAPWVLTTGVLTFCGGRLGATALGPELGLFVGAITAGLASSVYARVRKRPAPVTLVPALLLLVPGSVGFRSLTLLLRRDVLIGVDAAFRALLMLSALVAGLLIANVVTSPGRRGNPAAAPG